jgi:hypothetical protein
LKLILFSKKISKSSTKEYEVPIEINKPNLKARNPQYDLVVSADVSDFNFKIVRKATGTVM